MPKEDRNQPSPLTLETITQLAVETTLVSGRHAPTLVVEGNTQTVRLELTQTPPTPEGRALQMLTIGALLREQRQLGTLKQLFFISEAWLSSQATAHPARPRPSQDPNRQEVLIISRFQAHDEATQAVILAMRRDKKGELRELKPLLLPDEITSSNSPLLQAFVHGYQHGDA